MEKKGPKREKGDKESFLTGLEPKDENQPFAFFAPCSKRKGPVKTRSWGDGDDGSWWGK